MISARAFRHFAFTFGGAMPVLYVVALFRDIALFTVYPSLGLVMLGTHHSREVADPALGFLAPEMYWYGWTATAAVGALTVGLFATLVPDRWTQRLDRCGYGCSRCWESWGARTSNSPGFGADVPGARTTAHMGMFEVKGQV